MLPKDFENFEMRLQKLREESLEHFGRAEKYFLENYSPQLSEIFPRDILGVKREIGGFFITSYGESLRDKNDISAQDIFKKCVDYSISKIPLSSERKERLKKNIFFIREFDQTQEQFFSRLDDIKYDPFYALIEDFSLDGEISREEFILLQESFSGRGNFILALESLPEDIKKMFLRHIELSLEGNIQEKKSVFEDEFGSELSVLEKKGFNITPVVQFVARFYYKTPGKYRKYESPKRRLRRTMKLALLRLLRIKLGNIDAENILRKFEEGESFEDYFMILYKLLEVLDENPYSEEIYQLLAIEDEIQSDVFSAEENTQKILQGDFLVTKIASLFAKSDAKAEESQADDGILEKLLDESTDIVGEDIYFNRPENHSGIYAHGKDEQEDDEENEEDFKNMSPEVAYEILKRDFHRGEEEKTSLFAGGKYDEIDEINEKLLKILVRLEKLEKILHI